MIFIVWDPRATDDARRSGRVLARLAGLRGFSLATLSELLRCERLIGMNL